MNESIDTDGSSPEYGGTKTQARLDTSNVSSDIAKKISKERIKTMDTYNVSLDYAPCPLSEKGTENHSSMAVTQQITEAEEGSDMYYSSPYQPRMGDGTCEATIAGMSSDEELVGYPSEQY